MGQHVCKESAKSGGGHNGETAPIKTGVRYVDYRPHIRPFDLLLFKGDEFVSNFIRFLERRQRDGYTSEKVSRNRKKYEGTFSHSGLVVTSEVLDDPRLEPGKLYILESNLSGKLTDGVLNIDGKTFFGVQLRDLDEVVEKYNAISAKTRVAVCHLKSVYDPTRFKPDVDQGAAALALKYEFSRIFRRYQGRYYDYNPLELFASVLPCLRGEPRDVSDKIFGSRSWYFCSELVAAVYRDLGILPYNCDPRNCVPTDFLPDCDTDHEVDGYVQAPIYLI